MPAKKAPLGVIIIAVIMLIGGIFDIIAGISNLTFSVMFPMPWLTGLEIISGIILVLWGVIMLIAAFALMRLEYWAWLLVVIVNILNVVFGAVFFNMITLVISIIVLIYMFYKADLFK
ncbi:MAG: hypothetical protein ACTSYR_04580 [Candidatus Odinarchaeia archaeon]